MKRCVIVLLLITTMCLLDTRAQAHHSFAATYLEDQTVTIEGELVRFVFRNPHCFVMIMVKGSKDEAPVRYLAEWKGAGQLGAEGVTRETLRPGDHVIISGAPGRIPADHRVRMTSLRRPSDGFDWGHRPGASID